MLKLLARYVKCVQIISLKCSAFINIISVHVLVMSCGIVYYNNAVLYTLNGRMRCGKRYCDFTCSSSCQSETALHEWTRANPCDGKLAGGEISRPSRMSTGTCANKHMQSKTQNAIINTHARAGQGWHSQQSALGTHWLVLIHNVATAGVIDVPPSAEAWRRW